MSSAISYDDDVFHFLGMNLMNLRCSPINLCALNFNLNLSSNHEDTLYDIENCMMWCLQIVCDRTSLVILIKKFLFFKKINLLCVHFHLSISK